MDITELFSDEEGKEDQEEDLCDEEQEEDEEDADAIDAEEAPAHQRWSIMSWRSELQIDIEEPYSQRRSESILQAPSYDMPSFELAGTSSDEPLSPSSESARRKKNREAKRLNIPERPPVKQRPHSMARPAAKSVLESKSSDFTSGFSNLLEISEKKDTRKKVETIIPSSKNMSRRAPVLEGREEIPKISHKKPFKLMQFSGSYLVTATQNMILTWSLKTGKKIKAIRFRDKICDIAFCPFQPKDDSMCEVWVGLSDGRLLRVNCVDGINLEDIHVHGSQICKILVDEGKLLSLCVEGVLRVWTKIKPGRLKSAKNELSNRASSVSIKPSLCAIVGENADLWIAQSRNIELYTETERKYMLKATVNIGDIAGSIQTIISSNDKKYAFTGHSNGKIIVWDPKTLSPLKVIVVDKETNPINCIANFCDFLWIGQKKGKILILDSNNNWDLIMSWSAHQASLGFLKSSSDPYVNIIASSSDSGTVRFWDSSITHFRIESEVSKKESTFSTFSPMKVLILSWNVNARKPSDFKNELIEWTSSSSEPDVIVIGLQEIIDLENKQKNAKSFLKEIGSIDDEAGQKWTQAFQSVIQSSHPSTEYELIESKQMVGVYHCIFIKKSHMEHVSDVSIGRVKTGLAGLHGNKGSVGIRFVIKNSSICFINCHLAAGHSSKKERNNDFSTILRDTNFPENKDGTNYLNGGDGTSVLDHHTIFFFGDMNYRIDYPNEMVRKLIQEEQWEELFKYDQLNIVNNPQGPLKFFKEGEIRFAPTYKYDPGTNVYDTSEKGRIPAWCDRILWKGKNIELTNFSRKEFNHSDHKPIWATFDIDIQTIDPQKREKIKSNVRSEILRNEALRIVNLKKYILHKITGCSLDLCHQALNLCLGNMEDSWKWLLENSSFPS